MRERAHARLASRQFIKKPASENCIPSLEEHLSARQARTLALAEDH
jgi:hypothetical protein